jgi:hypothetical protein
MLNEREKFIAVMVEEFTPRHPAREVLADAKRIMRAARTHGRLAVEYCNGPEHLTTVPHSPERSHRAEQWEEQRAKRQAACERQLIKLCAPYGMVPRFGGDPRGYTVKLTLPSGLYNTWGGREEGYGVPQ